jgi:hypothetical protein
MLESGEARSMRGIERLGGVDESYVSRMVIDSATKSFKTLVANNVTKEISDRNKVFVSDTARLALDPSCARIDGFNSGSLEMSNIDFHACTYGSVGFI